MILCVQSVVTPTHKVLYCSAQYGQFLLCTCMTKKEVNITKIFTHCFGKEFLCQFCKSLWSSSIKVYKLQYQFCGKMVHEPRTSINFCEMSVVMSVNVKKANFVIHVHHNYHHCQNYTPHPNSQPPTPFSSSNSCQPCFHLNLQNTSGDITNHTTHSLQDHRAK